ncbi:FtsK/SpoIIIE domain-containing protein [Lentzea terrae]|uniref:FtsK/SpoIIIE domain-containing protein n=1 Tax=Lentzea terrae TaxID=2200761 RepID=UPI000DD382B0|nr:FtsK/SpoIIIE domain-containing protein [Lentzea terrae]
MRLELTCLAPGGARHAVLVQAADGHRVADLASALGEHLDVTAPDWLYLGTQPLPGQLSLGEAGLTDGAVLGLGLPVFDAGTGIIGGGAVELAVVGGMHAGPCVLLHPAGDVRIGRDQDAELVLADAEVSREHAKVGMTPDGSVIRLSDTGSRNGIRWRGWRLTDVTEFECGDVAGMGESVVGLRPAVLADADVAAGENGTRLFNRPPRIDVPGKVADVLVPVPPEKPTGMRFPWITVLLPLLVGGVLYLVLPNAGYFLLIMLLSPVMAVANVISDRRSGRKEYRARKKDYDQAKAALDDELTAAAIAEERRQRDQHPDPSWLVAVACAPSARLWERRHGDQDFLRLRLGLHDRPASVRPRFDPRQPQPTSGAAELPEPPPVHDVPATVKLRDAGVLGVAGPRDRVLAASRAILAQAAVLHAPKDLALLLITGHDEADDWEWASWLPHTRPPAGFECRRLLATDAAQARARLTELRELIEHRAEQQRGLLRQGRPQERDVLIVVDGACRMRGLPGLAQVLAEGPSAGVHALCLDDDEMALPDECRATLVINGSRGRLCRQDLAPVDDLLVDGLDEVHARRMARALAPIATLGAAAEDGSLPDRVRYTDLAGLTISGEPDSDADAVRRAWAQSPNGRSTKALLGVGGGGPLTVDLRKHGPHALVAGTSGAGKSELLQTLVTSLALVNTPDALTFVLVDYKGGSAFAACERLPHCVGLVTDLDGHLVNRALRSLSAELHRREALFAEASAKDIEDYWARTGARLPRLVIVVDEFASLVEEIPEFVPGVVGIGMRGRSLGVHVVLATQRPGGVVNADMRANLNLRIGLRVTADSESVDVIDTPVAARISANQPGRAYLRTGHGELTGFQAARIGWPRQQDQGRGAELSVCRRLVSDLGRVPELPAQAEVDPDGATDLAAVVAATRVAAGQLGVATSASPWLPPLPDLVTLAELEAVPRSSLCVPLGLADRPAAQAQDVFLLDLEATGPIVVAGAGRTGRSTALRTLAAGLTAGCGPDAVHVYGLDCGNRALAPLIDLPHVGAVVDADDAVRVGRLLEWLDQEIDRRQRILAAGGHATIGEQRRGAAAADRLPHLVLLLDRLEGFMREYAERDGGTLVQLFEGLLRRGPAAGLVVVLTSDKTGFSQRIAAAVEHRLVLRQADREDVGTFGLAARDMPGRMPPGRAVWSATGEEVQVALLDADPSGAAQIEALRRLGAQARAACDGLDPALLPHRIDPLPERISLRRLEELRIEQRPRGVAVCTPAAGGDHLGPMDVDLVAAGGAFLVAGPSGSGRSTALVAVVRSLTGDLPVVLVTPRPSPLHDLASLPQVRGMTDGARAELEDLLADGPVAVVVDDGELLDEYTSGEVLDRVVRGTRDTGSVVVAAATTDDLLLNRHRGWLASARRARSGLLLSPASSIAGEVFDLRLPRSTAGNWPPGRGLLVRRGGATLAQVPEPDPVEVR